METLRKLINNLFMLITIGLAGAFVLVFMRPDLLVGERETVEIVQRSSEPTATTTVATPLSSGPVSYATAAQRAAPAVVNINTAKVVTQQIHPLLNDPLFRQFFGNNIGIPKKRLQSSLGSGVLISAQGHILTNHHVVDGADQIRVQLHDGRTADATLVGADPDTDLAVLRIELDELPNITLADQQPLLVGDVVLAIGNPFGVGQTVTMGIVSATGRSRLGINTYENFIQTDAAINPGNSGGALINAHGELVGINTAIFSKSGGSQGIGFAIPVSIANDVMQQIIKHGHVIRGWFGVEAQDITPALAESFGLGEQHGVLIAGVLRGGPADLGDINPGDIVTHIDDIEVADSQSVMESVSRIAPGSNITLKGIREGEPHEWTVTVTERPAVGQR